MSSDIETESEELSFAEIYAAVTLNGEVIITIPKEEVNRVTVGIKNLKTRLASKMREDDLIPDPSVLAFVERVPADPLLQENFIDLSISLQRKSIVKVLTMRIPDQDF